MKITREILSTLMSGDYRGTPMDQVLEAMEANWDRYIDVDPWSIHSSELDHDGPTNYIIHLAQRMMRDGWDETRRPPIIDRYDNTVRDGHHRILAAFLAEVEIPDHVFPDVLTPA